MSARSSAFNQHLAFRFTAIHRRRMNGRDRRDLDERVRALREELATAQAALDETRRRIETIGRALDRLVLEMADADVAPPN